MIKEHIKIGLSRGVYVCVINFSPWWFLCRKAAGAPDEPLKPRCCEYDVISSFMPTPLLLFLSFILPCGVYSCQNGGSKTRERLGRILWLVACETRLAWRDANRIQFSFSGVQSSIRVVSLVVRRNLIFFRNGKELCKSERM